MRASQLAQKLNDAVLAEVGRLKSLSVAELLALGRSGRTIAVAVNNQTFEITAWSELVSHNTEGLFVVMAGAWQKRWLGSTHHVNGFVVRADREYTDMSDSELWHYD